MLYSYSIQNFQIYTSTHRQMNIHFYTHAYAHTQTYIIIKKIMRVHYGNLHRILLKCLVRGTLATLGR